MPVAPFVGALLLRAWNDGVSRVVLVAILGSPRQPKAGQRTGGDGRLRLEGARFDLRDQVSGDGLHDREVLRGGSEVALAFVVDLEERDLVAHGQLTSGLGETSWALTSL
jgi:hypothetical protein